MIGVMSDVTGDPRTCPKFQSIFICKYCEFDSQCGEIIFNMTEEEREELYAFLKELRMKQDIWR